MSQSEIDADSSMTAWRLRSLRSYAEALLIVIVISLAALPFREAGDPDNMTMIYLTGVVIIGLRYGLGAAFLASGASVIIFNFLFISPYYTLDVSQPRAYLTFFIMLVTSLAVAGLTSRISARAMTRGREQAETTRLLRLTEDLSNARHIEDIRAASVKHLARPLNAELHLHLRRDGLKIPTEVKSFTGMNWYLPLEIAGQSLGLVELRHTEMRTARADEVLQIEPAASLIAGALLRTFQSEDAAHLEATREAERLRNLLLSSLSHDLRTPLTVLSGTIGNLTRMRKKLPREAMDEIASLTRQIAYLQKFTGNLLKISAISAGQLVLNRQVYTIQEIIGVAIARLDELKGERHIHTVTQGDIPFVEIDGALIEQVMSNLLENAVRHTPEDGQISLELRRHADMVQVSVIDNGTGFGPGDEDLIFERFRTGNDVMSDRRSPGSAGLGLAVCRGIVEAHGGRIDARNNPGGGAHFYFTLPTIKDRSIDGR